jgi:hypothetical protein
VPWANNASIQSLRWQFNAALTAHSAAKRTLLAAMIDGTSPLPGLIAAEAKAKSVLEDVRAKLLAEMTKAITGGSESDPPPQS